GKISVNPYYTPFFVNDNGRVNGRSFQPFLTLLNRVHEEVYKRFGVDLTVEVKVIPHTNLIQYK
ncbi:MAG: hypothetical protein ABIJ08_06105, partial [Nanoarchaeota archaeon]